MSVVKSNRPTLPDRRKPERQTRNPRNRAQTFWPYSQSYCYSHPHSPNSRSKERPYVPCPSRFTHHASQTSSVKLTFPCPSLLHARIRRATARSVAPETIREINFLDCCVDPRVSFHEALADRTLNQESTQPWMALRLSRVRQNLK